MVKARISSVIRIWNFAFAETMAEAEHRLNPRGRPFAGFLCQPLHSGEVGLIHGQYEIERFKIIEIDLPRSAGQLNAAALGRGLHAAVGRISHMPTACSGGIHHELIAETTFLK